MTGPVNRRSMLGRAAAAAISGVGIGAMAQVVAAAPGDADTELLSLESGIAKADQALTAALDQKYEAEQAFFKAKPPRPAAPAYDVTQDDWFKAMQSKVAADEAARQPELIRHATAMKSWEQECENIREQCGLVDADLEASERSAEVAAICDLIAETRATTLAGLRFKAKYAARHYDDEYEPDVVTSIIDDLLALGGEGEEEHPNV